MKAPLAMAALALAVCAATAQGQGTPASVPTIGNMIAIDPLGIPLAIASIEYLGYVGGGAALGGSVSYTAPGGSHDAHWTTVEGQARYYPNERVFDGFSMVLSGGMTDYSKGVQITTPNGQTWERQSVRLASLGVMADYDWVLGTSQRFVVGGGLGAKRLIGDTGRLKALGGNVAYPIGRFVVGLLF